MPKHSGYFWVQRGKYHYYVSKTKYVDDCRYLKTWFRFCDESFEDIAGFKLKPGDSSVKVKMVRVK